MAERKTTEEFIADATDVHGDRYDYSRVVYTRAISKVEIICREHGPFMQSPNKHLSSGQGCKICGAAAQGAKKALDAESVIARAREKHGDRFEYDISSYRLTSTPIRIKCSVHGWFKQTPEAHILSRIGCKKCSHVQLGLDRAHDTSKFIEKSKLIHGERYSYGDTDYKRSGDRVIITCKDHGDFRQIPANHLNGYGCPTCAKNGFDVNSGAHLYVLESECGAMIKVGITKNIERRMTFLSRCTPFDFNLIAHYSGNGRHIKDDENAFHSSLMSCELKGFNGAREWFRYDHDIVGRIKKRAEALF